MSVSPALDHGRLFGFVGRLTKRSKGIARGRRTNAALRTKLGAFANLRAAFAAIPGSQFAPLSISVRKSVYETFARVHVSGSSFTGQFLRNIFGAVFYQPNTRFCSHLAGEILRFFDQCEANSISGPEL